MASNYTVPKGRKKGVSPIAIAVIVLIVALIAIVIVSFVSSLVSAESKGDVLELSVEWTAEQHGDDDYAKLTVKLYVNFDDMNVTSRKDNTLSVNGKTVTFESGSISGSSTKTMKKLLTTQEFEVLRKPGETVNYVVEAEWNFCGKTQDGMLDVVTLYDIITLDNYSVKMTNPPVVDDTTAADDDTTPEETTSDPEVTQPPVIDSIVTGKPVINPNLPENALYKNEVFTNETGSKFLSLVADCTAIETGKVDKDGDRVATVKVVLTFEYYSLYMSKREDCVLQVGNKVLNFEVAAINENIPAQHKRVIAELETEVKVGTDLKIYSRVPLVTTYGGERVNDIIIDSVMAIY